MSVNDEITINFDTWKLTQPEDRNRFLPDTTGFTPTKVKLEAGDHQWFDLSTWPDDFVGKWEPDYYAESIEKRLLDASPTLASGLDRTN